jgi:hypothetical protein
VDDIEVEAVFVCGRGEVGLRRGAEEEDEDNPRRAKSRLKLDNRERGGSGDEVFRVRAWKLNANGSVGEAFSAEVCVCLWKTVGSMIARCLLLAGPCADVVLRVGIVETGADE